MSEKLAETGRTERDWGDLEALPPQKSAFPRWLWFCGGGCLVMLILALLAGWWMFDWVQDGMDTEAQWERLAEVLPYDERTEDYVLRFGQKVPWFDYEVFVFMPVEFAHRPRADAEDTPREDAEPDASSVDGERQDSEPEGSEPDEGDGEPDSRAAIFVALMHFEAGKGDEDMFGDLEEGDGERIALRIQGRELVAYRLENSPTFPGMPSDPDSSVLVVLSEEGSGRELLLLFVRQGSTEPVSEAEIGEFLAPFHVGPDR